MNSLQRVIVTLGAGALLSSGCAGPVSVADTAPPPSSSESAAPSESAAAGGDAEMAFRFEAIAEGGCYRDSGGLYQACVRSKDPVNVVPAVTAETGLDFPDACAKEPCQRLLLQVPHAPALNPGVRPFRFGGELMVRPQDRSKGSNVLEKGFYDDPGGQWKLQIDGRGGRPSCVVQGLRGGKRVTAHAFATRKVGDGRWHKIICIRTASALVVEVDGVERGRADLATGVVANGAPVVIGAKNLQKDNDQFHGALRSVFMRLG